MHVIVTTMYVDTAKIKRKNKTYTRNLLRESYRDENGKVKHRTLLNLSMCSDKEVQAIKLALKHKDNLESLFSTSDMEATLGKSIGAVWTMNEIAKRVGVTKALGKSPQAKLALMQVIARVIDQGSRLSTVRFAKRQAVCEILGIKKVDEDDLYENLTWLAENQEEIEQNLFKARFPDTVPTLFLYDVTSSYLEGDQNEFAKWGYNRDKKKGKKQIVVGLMTGPDGLPVAVRVFDGNTIDTQTVAEQIRILSKSFGVKNVTLVGDRGMIKGPQIDAMPDDFNYVTAISKPQIQKKLGEGTFQLELFTNNVCEIEQDGVRYVLRLNPVRKKELHKNRISKLEAVKKVAIERTTYLLAHTRASSDKALEKVSAKISKLKIEKWVTATVTEREIKVTINEQELADAELLDGCYVIKSDLPKKAATAQELHDRYCDLEMVERAFRTMKTTHLELRPVYVRKKLSTQGHVFVVMLALLLQRDLEKAITGLDLTPEEAIDELAGVRMQEISFGNHNVQNIPLPTEIAQKVLSNASINLPKTLPVVQVNVHTKKKLPSERKR